jgi:hypothetical protein
MCSPKWVVESARRRYEPLLTATSFDAAHQQSERIVRASAGRGGSDRTTTHVVCYWGGLSEELDVLAVLKDCTYWI